MRPVAFATLCVGLLTACESEVVQPVVVQWMDWPAEVTAGQPFRTRLVVWGICAVNPRFFPGATSDESAVEFAPYFLADDVDNIACLARASSLSPLLIAAIDTAGTAPGLPASVPRLYEMRGTAVVSGSGPTLLPDMVRTFGDVTVRPGDVTLARRNAAGSVFKDVDTTGCVRIRPLGLYHPDAAFVLEDQADTAGLSGAFVRGYLHDVTAPVCGETRVFHLESVN